MKHVMVVPSSVHLGQKTVTAIPYVEDSMVDLRVQAILI
jgi:hypothetical protein